MEALGFPMGGNVDTFLMSKEKEDWTSKKGTRRDFVGKDYRVLLLLGDNYGDFSDDYGKSEAERLASFQANMAHIGHDWIFIANVELEQHHVAVGDDVFLAFVARLAGVLRRLLAAEADEVVVGDGLGADEALLEIGVDDAGRLRRLGAAPIVQARTSFGPAVK